MVRRLAVAACVLALGCSDASDPPAPDASVDTGIVTPDGSSPRPDAGARLLPHDGTTLPKMQLGIVYVGDVDAGGPPVDDPDIAWLVGSPYWLYLDEYGIGNGALVGSVRVSTAKFFQAGDVDAGLVDVSVMQARLAGAIHGDGDAGTGLVSLPGAEAYLVYLPDGVNVVLGHRGSYTYQTCIDADGYHGFDGVEPYAVLPPCPDARTLFAAAHELSEMATDPQPYHGWVSDTDIGINGGEVADLCAEQVMQEGVIVTRLWSNRSAGCVP
jgi:hypothetical protein